MSVVQRKRIKSIGNISYSDYYNSLICSSCTTSEKQCHYKHLFDDYDDKINLLFEKDKYKLFGFPKLSNIQINGIIGPSNSGKTLLLKILGKKIKLIGKNRNSENDNIQSDYMAKLYFNEISISYKEQKIKSFKKHRTNLVISYLLQKGHSRSSILRNSPEIIDDIICKEINTLSIGELQMLHVWSACNRMSDVYILDEPFKYLDMWQKIKVANMINRLKDNYRYIIVTDNDTTIMDYLCDNLMIINSVNANEHVILNTNSISTTKYINDNMPKFIIPKYKKYDELGNGNHILTYKNEITDNIQINKGYFSLYNSINIIFGPALCGKTYFMYWIKNKFNEYTFSIKDENIKCPWYTGTVLEVLRKKIPQRMSQLLFCKEIIRPLKINLIYDKLTKYLSIQEKQLIEIIICLGTEAQIYMIDGLTKHLDYKQRISVTNVVKSFVIKCRKALFVIDDDILACTTLNKDTNTSLFITKRKNDIIKILGPTYFNHAVYKEFNILFYDTACGRPMIS